MKLYRQPIVNHWGSLLGRGCSLNDNAKKRDWINSKAEIITALKHLICLSLKIKMTGLSHSKMSFVSFHLSVRAIPPLLTDPFSSPYFYLSFASFTWKEASNSSSVNLDYGLNTFWSLQSILQRDYRLLSWLCWLTIDNLRKKTEKKWKKQTAMWNKSEKIISFVSCCFQWS